MPTGVSYEPGAVPAMSVAQTVTTGVDMVFDGLSQTYSEGVRTCREGDRGSRVRLIG